MCGKVARGEGKQRAQDRKTVTGKLQSTDKCVAIEDPHVLTTAKVVVGIASCV